MSYTAYTDQELLLLLKTGDERAFTEIYNRYWKLILSLAFNKVGTLVEAEEIVQEVFADIWKRRDALQIQVSVKSYLAAATKFQVYTLLAKKQKQQRMLDGIQQEYVTTPEQQLDFKNLQISIDENINCLPEKCQLIYLLKQEGLTNKQVAEKLNISMKTVECQTTTALRRLRASINYIFLIFLK